MLECACDNRRIGYVTYARSCRLRVITYWHGILNDAHTDAKSQTVSAHQLASQPASCICIDARARVLALFAVRTPQTNLSVLLSAVL